MQTSQGHKLIADHLDFSEAVAIACVRKFDLDGLIPVDDAVAWGQRGLVEAAGRYSPASGTKFSTFCFKRIQGAVIDGVRRERRSRRGEAFRQKSAAASVDGDASDTSPAGLFDHASVDVETLPQEEHLPADAALNASRLRETVLRAINSLPELERASTLLYFYEGLDLTRIAKRFGISKGYSCRIHWRAIRQLTEALAGVAETFDVEVGK